MSLLSLQIKKREALEAILADKVGRTYDPYVALTIPYALAAKNTNASRSFTEEEDRFLICKLNILGYGAWQEIKNEVRRAEQFRFNWFMKSRTVEDLHRRCDFLTRILEKERSEAMVADEASKKKASSSSGTTAGTSTGNKRKRPQSSS